MENTNGTCPICYDVVEPTIDYTLTRCGHAFHSSCLIQWAQSKPNKTSCACPLCTRELYTPDRQDQRQEWFDANGLLHREDGPAIICPNGTKYWYQHGKRHRDDGPAIEAVDGYQEWYQHGKHHRSDGPAVIWPNGTKCWYQHGQLHRLDGPAYVDPDGYKAWYRESKRHREDGPAIVHADGRQYWYYQGKEWHFTWFGYRVCWSLFSAH